MNHQIAGVYETKVSGLLRRGIPVAVIFVRKFSFQVFNQQTKRSIRMERFIKIDKEQVKVSEEIYKEYYKMVRRARYFEKDIKVGSSSIDESGNVTYKPNKEDSIERLSELGVDFEDDNLIEDIVCDKAILTILNEALKELEQEEMELISDLYLKNLTTRQASEKKNISQSTVIKRHKKIIEKLKKYF